MNIDIEKAKQSELVRVYNILAQLRKPFHYTEYLNMEELKVYEMWEFDDLFEKTSHTNIIQEISNTFSVHHDFFYYETGDYIYSFDNLFLETNLITKESFLDLLQKAWIADVDKYIDIFIKKYSK